MALVPFPNKAAKPLDDEPDWDDHEAEEEAGGKMSFLDHLDELRRRIITSLIAVGVAFVATFTYVDEILLFIILPMQRILPAGQSLSYIDPTEGFFLKVKVALMAGLLVAAPVVFSQVWLFIAPGLYAHEKKLAVPFIAMSTVFFVGGAVFSHYVVFPIVWKFLSEQTVTDPATGQLVIAYAPRVEPAFAMYLRLMLALGVVFELPTLVLFLARMGVVTPRFMLRNFKYAVMIIMVAAALLSPDGGGVGMIAMGAPVIVLYILSIGLAGAFGKKRNRLEEGTT